MTPDTLNYMVAGYIVIVLGIAGYILSLVVRSINVKKKVDHKVEQERTAK